MLSIVYSKAFKKSKKILEKSGRFNKGKIELELVIDIVASGKMLDQKYHDHGLQGEWKGYRECHVQPDLLLIYKIYKDELLLLMVDVGSHSSLFGQ